MQVYKIPYNFNHEEKIFGGYISIRQAIYLILSASLIGIFFIPMLNVFIKSIIFLTLTGMLVSFAFFRMDETNMDKYFIYFLTFLFAKKEFILEKGKKI